ncbi:DeoR/GlpR family DNA-binding transcription regulator [Mesorhizobium sp.]|uniref:DeoR/GlpR family DNA-binding transcription regulator n=1 Tax=Mesorhizobium sp. TaxID=1871066 RepID=UPI0011F71A2A|nr:DeoR/GlpR family DNA-binding transcription regulator [Mesorhizobium sp.]TIS98039.1 MAG: DeoR/GlpR transcriptional regulator [Mesorhizobium sp.]
MKDDRLSTIRHFLYVNGPSSIQDLVNATGASLATLRRDLGVLEEEGIIDRVHGGARLAEGSNIEVGFSERENENIEAKRAIADAAYRMLKPHSTVFLDAGTTVLQLARRLRIEPLPLTVFTNGLAIAYALLNTPKVQVTVLGGQLRNENASIVGPLAEAMLDRLWFDQLFLGAGAINDDNAIYSVDLSEATINARMLSRAAQRLVLADHSKFARAATYLVAPLLACTHVVTDAGIAPEWRERIKNIGLSLTVSGGVVAEETPA